MSSIVISGDTSGSISLQAPAVAGNTTLNLPAVNGTLSIGGVGEGQTWQDVKASRSLGTTYTNTTGKPIWVNIRCNTPSAAAVQLTVGGVVVYGNAYAAGGLSTSVVNAIVPNNATYVTSTSGITLDQWVELR